MIEWLIGTEGEEKAEEEGKKRHQENKGVWWLLIKLVQYIWETNKIPWQMLRMIVALHNCAGLPEIFC